MRLECDGLPPNISLFPINLALPLNRRIVADQHDIGLFGWVIADDSELDQKSADTSKGFSAKVGTAVNGIRPSLF
jgi:hypothetical protein